MATIEKRLTRLEHRANAHYRRLNALDNSENPPLRYVALLSQSGTDDPTAIVLENTLGEIPTLSRYETGAYTLDTVGEVFTENKTVVLISDRGNPLEQVGANIETVNQVQITTFYANGTNTDAILANTAIVIIVYP